METEWCIARAQLREQLGDNPKASHRQLAEALGYSVAWVRKWRKRLAGAPPDDETVLHCQSHRPKTIPRKVSEAMEERIVAMRATLSEEYNRKVGPRTIAAKLRQAAPEGEGIVPTSTATIWRILHRRQAILPAPTRHKQPFERSGPGVHWEIDCCTAANQSEEAPEKQANALEVFNVVDQGSSAVINSVASAHIDAEEALRMMEATFRRDGVAYCVSYDRDPRFIGSQSTDGYPSALTRYLLCVGCTPEILPPRRPDLKPFVERFQRTLKEECLDKYRPSNSSEANTCLPPYCQRFNQERPHQGDVNHDQPPALCLALGPTLPRLPEKVDPDAWLSHYDNRCYRRHVDSRGAIQLWKQTYYIGTDYLNQTVLVRLDAPQRMVHIELSRKRIKSIPLKGLSGLEMDYPDFLELMCDEARSEWKQYLWRQRLKRKPAQPGLGALPSATAG